MKQRAHNWWKFCEYGLNICIQYKVSDVKLTNFLGGRTITFIALPLKFISEYSSEFQYDFNRNNFMYEKKNNLSQPPILIEISARLLDAIYRNNINEKCVISL